MLYRSRGSILFVQPAGGEPLLSRDASYYSARSLRQGVRDYRRSEASEHNPHAALGPWAPYVAPPAPEGRGRRRPGVETPLRHHDPVALFSNVYGLGPAHEFSMARLLEVCSW